MIVRKITDRTKARYNVAISEISDNDILNSIVIGFACVSNSNAHAKEMTDNIIKYIESFGDAEIIDVNAEIFKI